MSEQSKEATTDSMACLETASAQPQSSLSGGETPIDTYLSQVSFWTPQFIEVSAWLDHAPFAFWLTSVLRPRTFVELGAHRGNSYFAFCQAVNALGLPTRCYAVDTWKGDEHSGFYGEEVFRRVRDYNEIHYAACSRLMRSTFDQALAHFSDASIDLLHIDGRHFYEDVKYDFTSWRPKLSDRAVVLFHDTNFHERNFGVYRFWDEISASFPSFEFLHGHGLGVLGIGANLPKEIATFLKVTRDTSVAINVRHVYATLGSRLIADQQSRAYVARLDVHKAEAKQNKATLQAEDGRAAELMTKLQSLDTEAKESRREVKHLKAKLKNAASTAAAMRRSASWRITKPLRLVSRGARWILRKARRALTLASWLDSGQSGRADEGSHTPFLNLGKLPKSGPAASRLFRVRSLGVTVIVGFDERTPKRATSKQRKRRLGRAERNIPRIWLSQPSMPGSQWPARTGRRP